jgi:hypothetical protein
MENDGGMIRSGENLSRPSELSSSKLGGFVEGNGGFCLNISRIFFVCLLLEAGTGDFPNPRSDDYDDDYLFRTRRVQLALRVLRHGASGFTSPPKEGVLRIIIALKNQSLQPGFNLPTLRPMASTLTTRPPKTTSIHINGFCVTTMWKILGLRAEKAASR